MAVLLCERCGGKLQKDSDGFYKCAFCGTVQTINYTQDDIARFAAENTVENVYFFAKQALALKRYSDALRLFSGISGYKDADQCIEMCNNLIAAETNESVYSEACRVYNNAKTEAEFRSAAELFDKIIKYRDSSSLYKEALRKADECHLEETYQKALSFMEQGNIHFLNLAAKMFDEISDYKDSVQKRDFCTYRVKQIEEELQTKNTVINAEREKKRASKRAIYILIGVILFILYIVFVISEIK